MISSLILLCTVPVQVPTFKADLYPEWKVLDYSPELVKVGQDIIHYIPEQLSWCVGQITSLKARGLKWATYKDLPTHKSKGRIKYQEYPHTFAEDAYMQQWVAVTYDTERFIA